MNIPTMNKKIILPNAERQREHLVGWRISRPRGKKRERGEGTSKCINKEGNTVARSEVQWLGADRRSAAGSIRGTRGARRTRASARSQQNTTNTGKQEIIQN